MPDHVWPLRSILSPRHFSDVLEGPFPPQGNRKGACPSHDHDEDLPTGSAFIVRAGVERRGVGTLAVALALRTPLRVHEK